MNASSADGGEQVVGDVRSTRFRGAYSRNRYSRGWNVMSYWYRAPHSTSLMAYVKRSMARFPPEQPSAVPARRAVEGAATVEVVLIELHGWFLEARRHTHLQVGRRESGDADELAFNHVPPELADGAVRTRPA